MKKPAPSRNRKNPFHKPLPRRAVKSTPLSPVRTVDAGVPEPMPYEGSGFDYAPDYERVGRIVERIPNAGGAV